MSVWPAKIVTLQKTYDTDYSKPANQYCTDNNIHRRKRI